MLCADGSVGSPHVRVGHRQAFISKAPFRLERGFFRFGRCVSYANQCGWSIAPERTSTLKINPHRPTALFRHRGRILDIESIDVVQQALRALNSN